jgi:hypothetical protein
MRMAALPVTAVSVLPAGTAPPVVSVAPVAVSGEEKDEAEE